MLADAFHWPPSELLDLTLGEAAAWLAELRWIRREQDRAVQRAPRGN